VIRILPLLLAAACASSPPPSAPEPEVGAGTPVRVATVARRTLHETVTAPGRTDALQQVHLRVPFAGTLASLSVTDGDRVRAGQVLGMLRSRESEAALVGARRMAAAAATDVQQADAARALAIAKADDVTWPLKAPSSGVVLSHTASAGDRLGEGDEVLDIAPAKALFFRADLPQGALDRVRAGEAALVKLASRPKPLEGIVHGVLPQADGAALSAPVRIDLRGAPAATGLFGQATITVGQRADVLTAPRAAVLTDDVEGTTRVAEVQGGKAHWVDVSLGLTEGDQVEITKGLAEGDPVIVAGQVGLPEGAPVKAGP